MVKAFPRVKRKLNARRESLRALAAVANAFLFALCLTHSAALIAALRFVDDYLRRRFVHFELRAHLLRFALPALSSLLRDAQLCLPIPRLSLCSLRNSLSMTWRWSSHLVSVGVDGGSSPTFRCHQRTRRWGCPHQRPDRDTGIKVSYGKVKAVSLPMRMNSNFIQYCRPALVRRYRCYLRQSTKLLPVAWPKAGIRVSTDVIAS